MPHVQLTDAYGVVYSITSRDPELVTRWLAEWLPTANPNGAYVSQLRVIPLHGEDWPGLQQAQARTLDGLILALQEIQANADADPERPPGAQM